jgi:lysophospholipase L1-like esterase
MDVAHQGRSRQSTGAVLAGCLLVLLTGAFPRDVQADDAARGGSDLQPALSASCEAPAQDIAVNGPLPNVVKALEDHKTLEILAIGSASAASLGVDAGIKSYPVQLEDLLKETLKGVDVDIINRGTGGEVAQTSADRIRGEVALTKPDLVLWQLGTNDALARVSSEQFTDTVKSTIEWLKSNNTDVVLVGLQYTTRFAKDESYYQIRAALNQIAKGENVLYVKRYDAMKFISQTRAKVHLMASDNYHLSALGTQCMAEHVARAMTANLFVRRFRPVGAGTPPAAN